MLPPLKQGVVSGECIIYSALNAVRFIYPKVFETRESCEALYTDLLKVLKPGWLKAMLIEGTGTREAEHVAAAMQAVLAHEYDIHLAVTKPRISTFEEIIVPRGSALITGLDSPWNHWSVLISSDRSHFRWYDSYDEAIPIRHSFFYLSTTRDTSRMLINMNKASFTLYSPQ